jgi:hypothetical protein
VDNLFNLISLTSFPLSAGISSSSSSAASPSTSAAFASSSYYSYSLRAFNAKGTIVYTGLVPNPSQKDTKLGHNPHLKPYVNRLAGYKYDF